MPQLYTPATWLYYTQYVLLYYMYTSKVLITIFIVTEPRTNEGTFKKPNWFENVREEHLACRENVAIFDLSSFAKFEIEVGSPHAQT